MKTQAQIILKYMESGKVMTLPIARRIANCERLAARINDLRNAGHNIETKMVKLRTGKRVAEYRLVA